MNITIREPKPQADREIVIDRHDVDLLTDIAKKVGPIQAMRVFRWKEPEATLLQAKNFIEGLVK